MPLYQSIWQLHINQTKSRVLIGQCNVAVAVVFFIFFSLSRLSVTYNRRDGTEVVGNTRATTSEPVHFLLLKLSFFYIVVRPGPLRAWYGDKNVGGPY